MGNSEQKNDQNIASIDDLFSKIVDDAFVESSNAGSISSDDIFIGRPVSMLEFAMSSKYLNLVVSAAPLYQKIQAIIKLIDQGNIREVYLILGKGSGKSTICSIALLYGAYTWSCFRDPFAYFKVGRTSKVACVNVSVSREQAKDVIFEGCLDLVTRSPFFKGRYKSLNASIEFDSDITLFCGHGNAAAWLGYATYVGVMDEVEFLMDSNNRSQAKALYGALRGSLRTRFPSAYKLIAISSAKETHGFLMNKCQQTLRLGKQIIV